MSDGGWGWCANSPSDPFLTAYVLSVDRASQAGEEIDEAAIQSAIGYLQATMPAVDTLEETWELTACP
jgi:uncharacterized protein YfaS (alpha-2-macroglobulin family)